MHWFNIGDVNKKMHLVAPPLPFIVTVPWMSFLPDLLMHVQVKRCRNSDLVHRDTVELLEMMFVGGRRSSLSATSLNRVY